MAPCLAPLYRLYTGLQGSGTPLAKPLTVGPRAPSN